MDYAIIYVGQLGHHLESNKINTVVDITSAVIFGSTFFPEHIEDYIFQPPLQLDWAIWLDLANEMWTEEIMYRFQADALKKSLLVQQVFLSSPATANEKVSYWDGRAHVRNSLYCWG